METPPAEQLDLLDGLLACIDSLELEGYAAVLFDRDGRVPACNLPPLASTMLRFTVADARLIPGAVIVLANQTPCVLLGVSEVGVHDVVIGEEGQPAACSRAGVELSFIDGRGRSLALRSPLRDGAVEVFGNWAPDPPHEEPEPGRPNFDIYLGNITRCYHLFEGGVEERVLLVADRGGKFPSCPEQYRDNLRVTEPTAAPTPTSTAAGSVTLTPLNGQTPEAVAAGEATATDTTAAIRNVAASVVAAIVVAGLAALGVEARARRRGGREAR